MIRVNSPSEQKAINKIMSALKRAWKNTGRTQLIEAAKVRYVFIQPSTDRNQSRRLVELECLDMKSTSDVLRLGSLINSIIDKLYTDHTSAHLIEQAKREIEEEDAERAAQGEQA